MKEYDFSKCVGSGWVPLVEELDRNILELDPGRKINQVKEKFGGLRYYITTSSDLSDDTADKICDLIEEAESKSITICEACGAPGRLCTPRWWILTLCEECEKRRVEENKTV